MILYYIIAALAGYILGRLSRTDSLAVRLLSAFVVFLVSVVVMTYFKQNYYAEVVSAAAGVPVSPESPIDFVGAAVVTMAFWTGMTTSTSDSGEVSEDDSGVESAGLVGNDDEGLPEDTPEDIEAKLATLRQLHESGVISDAAYEAKQARLLDKLL